MLLFALVVIGFMIQPMTVKADGIPISLGYVPFDEHRGMSIKINGEDGFCVQRGYPFRSNVSDIQMLRVAGEDITMSEWIRKNLMNYAGQDVWEYFRGWGTWTLNGDHTDASQTSQSGVPSSDIIDEVFEIYTIEL